MLAIKNAANRERHLSAQTIHLADLRFVGSHQDSASTEKLCDLDERVHRDMGGGSDDAAGVGEERTQDDIR